MISTTGVLVIRDCQLRCGESLSTAAQQQSQIYPDHVRFVADQIARDTFSLYRHAAIQMISGQMEYVAPYQPYDLQDVSCVDQVGNVIPMQCITPAVANGLFRYWQNPLATNPYPGIPRYYIREGLDMFKVLPIPNYNAINGFILSGLWGVDKWYNLNDPAPLPTGSDTCWKYGVVVQRCLEMKRIEPAYAVTLQDYEPRYEDAKCNLYRQISDGSAALTSQVPSKGGIGYYDMGQGWAFVE